jgi:hypothetical protein
VSLRRAWAAWERFWFAPVSARGLGAMRASLGLLLMVGHLQLWPDLDLLFGAEGPVPLWAVQLSLPWPRHSALDHLGGPLGLRLFHLAGTAVLLCFTLGYRARLAAWLALLLQVWLYQRDPWYQHGGDRVLRFATLFVALGPSGAALSVDAWLAARRGGPVASALVPALSRRLVQLQLVLIYMHSGFVKAQGRTWHEGTALYYALSDGQYQRAPRLVEALLDQAWFGWIGRIGTWLTLGWEAGFGLLLPWAPTRALAIGMGLLVHGGIGLLLNVGSFVWVMLWCYLALLPPDWVERLGARLAARRG